MELVPVVLCGGAGSRLWPVSRKLLPKQLTALTDERDSLLQQTIRRVGKIEGAAPSIVVCNEEHRFLVAEQCRETGSSPAAIILEPVGRNTAPAVALAAHEAIAAGGDPILLVLPADHVIRDEAAFRAAVSQGLALADKGRLITFGIVPAEPHSGYGYIRRGAELGGGAAFEVAEFVEKPDIETARRYVDDGGYLWNSGMFMFRASSFLEELEAHAPDIASGSKASFDASVGERDFRRVPLEEFSTCRGESIDYAVMEKTDRTAVVPLAADWSDVGEWAALWEIGDRDASGNAVSGDTCLVDVRDSFIRAESRLVAGLGLDGVVVIETSDAVLVADKSRSQDVKQIVARLEAESRPETVAHAKVIRPWGSYEGLAAEAGFQVKRIIVNPGGTLSLQLHHQRAEHWVVVRGEAKVQVGEKEFILRAGESTYIPVEEKHRLANETEEPLYLIEVQCGAYLGEDDIVRFEDVYGRAGTS